MMEGGCVKVGACGDPRKADHAALGLHPVDPGLQLDPVADNGEPLPHLNA